MPRGLAIAGTQPAMRDGEVPAGLWSSSLCLDRAPPWVALLFGAHLKNVVLFSVSIGPGPQYIMLGPDTSDASVCVFERGPRCRLAVLCNTMSTRAFVAGRSGVYRRFNIRRLFRLGISNEAWVRMAALSRGRPRFSEHMSPQRLFLGPLVDLKDNNAVKLRIQEVVRSDHFEVGVLPVPAVMAKLLTDPLLPPERGALEAGVYIPEVAPGRVSESALDVRVSERGDAVVFADFLTALTTLGPLYAAGARGFVGAGELARICRRQNIDPEEVPETLAWAAADMDGKQPTVVPITVAYELFRQSTLGFLRRWAARVLSLLEGAVAPPVYSVQRRRLSSSAPPGDAYTGRGRRVSVSAPATSPDGAASSGEFTLVMDETGEASGLVPSDALVPIQMEPGCPGAGLDSEHKKHAEEMLGVDEGLQGVTLSVSGLVSKLPLCVTSQYRDPVTGSAVPLTDLRRYFLSKVLWGLRRDPAQKNAFSAQFRADIATQGPIQQGRMVQVLTRGRAMGSIRPCSSCTLSTVQTCYKELYDGKLGKVPELPENTTVVDLVLAVKHANAVRLERVSRAAAQKRAGQEQRAKTKMRGGKRPASAV